MKNFIKIFLMILMTINLSYSQNAELISQQITIENAIKTKVDAVINKFLKSNEYLTIVNARLDFKPLSLQSVEQEKDDKLQSNEQYSIIPGLMPSIPTRQSIYQKNNNNMQQLNYSGEKYILYQLEIIIYLDESVSTGSLQTNLSTVVMQNLKEVDCENCIRFETLELPGQGNNQDKDSNLQELLDEIDDLKETMRTGQLEIKDNQINELEDINAKYLDEIQGFQNHLKEQDRIRQEAEE